MRAANKGDRISLYVEDKGNGTRLEDLCRIFEHFYRVDKGRSRAMGGTVSGLAIVRHIVKAHALQVKVESRVGEGATFTIGLQLAS